MERFFKIAFLLGIVFSFLFFIASNPPAFAKATAGKPVFAAQQGGGGAAPACIPSRSVCSSSTSGPFDCNVTIVYSCTNNFCGKGGGAITQATKFDRCETITTSCSNGCTSSTSSRTRIIGGPFYRNFVQPFTTAGKYQICPTSGNSWAANPPSYQCSAQCYPAPDITPLDKVEKPKNVFDGKNPKLPVHFQWEDNVEKELAKPESENKNPEIGFCSVELYKYNLSEQGATTPLLEKEVQPDPVPPNPANPTSNRSVIPFHDECKMQPSTPYDFQVQACLQGVCGDPGKLAFATSTAPQLLSPYDPDWEEEKSATTPYPAILKWCPSPNQPIKSYSVKAYTVNNNGTKGNSVLGVPGVPANQTEYNDSSLQGHLNDLKKGLFYLWEVAPCTDSNAEQCGIFSQLWKVVPGGELKAPIQLSPSSDDHEAFVNMTDALQWQQVVFATHYVVHIQGGSINKDFFTQGTLSLESIWQELALTTPYQWKVAPCGGPPTSQEIEDCKNKKDINDKGTVPWSKEQQFTTTGAQPLKLKVTPTEAGVAGIPLTIDWDDMGGAASYEIIVAPNPRIVSDKSETTLQYPMLETKTLYSFAVKTCADKLANVCGPEAVGSFTTVTLAAPLLTVPSPGQKEFEPSVEAMWNPVFSGNFYSYTLRFLSTQFKDAAAICKSPFKASDGIIPSNSANVRFRCFGDYVLEVKACIDLKCQEAGPTQTLPIKVENILAPTGGLVPCDRGKDSVSTGWDDTKPCGLEDVFLVIRNIIDFALWKLSLIIVVLMAIATGAIMFFSFGGIDVMTKVRSIWKAVGIGVLILLFSWLFLNILLDLVGFNVNAFGQWHDLPL